MIISSPLYKSGERFKKGEYCMSSLGEIIKMYTTNSYKGLFQDEIINLLQKRIFCDMMLYGKMIIKDKQICLKHGSHLGNCAFYLFENSKCMLGTSEYEFKKVDFSAHKNYANFLNSIPKKEVNINNVDVNKLKLYLLSGKEYVFAKIQYLSAINDSSIQDYATYDYKSILEDIYTIYDNKSYFDEHSRTYKINKILEKHSFNIKNEDTIKYLDFKFLTYANFLYKSVRRNLPALSHLLEKTFNDKPTLDEFIKINTVQDLMSWLNIKEYKKADLRTAFQIQKLNTDLHDKICSYIQNVTLQPHEEATDILYFAAIKQYKKLQEYFRIDTFYTKLAQDLKII